MKAGMGRGLEKRPKKGSLMNFSTFFNSRDVLQACLIGQMQLFHAIRQYFQLIKQ